MRRPESGFALPLTVFLIAIITLLLTTAFTRVTSDRRIGDASGANVAAMSIAKAALHQYLGTRTTRPADGDSVRINVTGGYGDVIAQVLRKPVDTLANWMFVVRAVGHVINPTQGADPQAVRTIAQFAQWQTGRMDVLAAYTAANRLNAPTGGTGQFNGADACGGASVWAIMVGSGGPGPPALSDPPYSTSGLGFAPHVVAPASKKTVADSTRIDWLALTAGGFTPDYTSAINVRTHPSDYASQIITSDSARLNDPSGGGTTTGTGLLITTGNLYVTGDLIQWNGIVLIGGRLVASANDQRFDGFVVSGLKEQLGTAVSNGDLGAGYLDIDYDSCIANTTLAKLTGFAPITNGWIDNWATY